MRRPLCRFLVYIGERGALADNHWVYRYIYAEPVAVFAGDSDLWGELPFVDGVCVIPPVQLGFPQSQARRRAAIYGTKGLPRIWINDERCIELQRKHFVFAFEVYRALPEWSYQVRDYLACGGRPDAAHFTGLRRLRVGGGEVYFCAGMVRSRTRCAVGQFGSMLRDELSGCVFGRECRNHAGSDERYNLHIPCQLEATHMDRSRWPVIQRPSGEEVLLDPGHYYGKPDIVDERNVAVSLGVRPHGGVHIQLPISFHDEGRDQDVWGAAPEDRAASSCQTPAERFAAWRLEVEACVNSNVFRKDASERVPMHKIIRPGCLAPYSGRGYSPVVPGAHGGVRRDQSRNGAGRGRNGHGSGGDK